MSIHWINITPRLQQGVALINSLNQSRFTLLIKRIIQSENEIFTEAELTKLSESLKLDSANLQLLLQSIVHIFKQSLKIILKPTALQEQLIEKLKFTEEKADDFVRLWTEETKRNFDVENSKNLDNVSWELNVESACSFYNKEQHINARLQMSLLSVDGEDKEHVTLELDENELENLYATLEKIQNKLDSI
ncbi:uncharacterized protein LOC135139758 [Zophobas morio]|uniref:uncharacterized protein LOC135139758 n=1 Tax=Zophobas morio TaxID=2755281 RepID=UPI00308332BA